MIKHFKTWLNDKPTPRTCLTDQGRNYMSQKFKNFLETVQIKHITTTPYNPTGNSISERINQTVNRVLQTSKRIPIKRIIRRINFVLQNQPHRVLMCSPYEIRFGKSNFDENNNKLGGYSDWHRQRILEAGKENLERINQTRKKINLKIGEKIYRKKLIRKKLSPFWTGPFVIKELDPSGNVVTIIGPNREEKLNIKLVRPIKEGQDVRP